MFSFLNVGFRKVGGIYFWNVGRIGGSFYVTSRATFARKQLRTAVAQTDREWAPYGWTADGFQRHMDCVANEQLLREVIYV